MRADAAPLASGGDAVALVVPGRNCSRTLALCLEAAVALQRVEPVLREVVYVDDGSSDESPAIGAVRGRQREREHRCGRARVDDLLHALSCTRGRSAQRRQARPMRAENPPLVSRRSCFRPRRECRLSAAPSRCQWKRCRTAVRRRRPSAPCAVRGRRRSRVPAKTARRQIRLPAQGRYGSRGMCNARRRNRAACRNRACSGPD